MLKLLTLSAWGVISVFSATSLAAQAPVYDLTKGGASSGRAATLEERVARVERLLDSQTLTELTVRLESIQQEVQRLLGDMEMQIHNIGQLKQRQRELYLDIDRRLQAMESGGAAKRRPVRSSAGTRRRTPGSGKLGSADMGGSFAPPRGRASPGRVLPRGDIPTKATPAEGDDDERVAYQQAFSLLRQRKYQQVIKRFKEFLKRYPDGEYAHNAQYWLGEVNYVQRNFDAALVEFGQVINRYPDSPKFADAMLKIGLVQYELKNWGRARLVFDEISGRFPNTVQSQMAEKRLQRMKLEGH